MNAIKALRKVRTGDVVRAEDHNDLIDSVERMARELAQLRGVLALAGLGGLGPLIVGVVRAVTPSAASGTYGSTRYSVIPYGHAAESVSTLVTPDNRLGENPVTPIIPAQVGDPVLIVRSTLDDGTAVAKYIFFTERVVMDLCGA